MSSYGGGNGGGGAGLGTIILGVFLGLLLFAVIG